MAVKASPGSGLDRKRRRRAACLPQQVREREVDTATEKNEKGKDNAYVDRAARKNMTKTGGV